MATETKASPPPGLVPMTAERRGFGYPNTEDGPVEYMSDVRAADGQICSMAETTAESEARARYIVRAVNNHEALVTIAMTAAAQVEFGGDFSPRFIRRLRDEARALLARIDAKDGES